MTRPTAPTGPETSDPETTQAAASLALPDAAATRALGARLGRALAPGDVVALAGELGMGKSELARAAIRARLDAPELEVPSPTFTLVQSYEAPGLEIWHVDLYRLGAPDEALELGLEEAHGEGALLIEWPERLGGLLPATRLDIRLAPGDAGGRIAQLGDPEGAWADRIAGLLA